LRARRRLSSANFDDRSFETNDELTLAFLDAATARKLDGIFEKYVARAEEIRLEEWSKRSRVHRLLDHANYLANEIL
jgi:cardiolipin synthase